MLDCDSLARRASLAYRTNAGVLLSMCLSSDCDLVTMPPMQMTGYIAASMVNSDTGFHVIKAPSLFDQVGLGYEKYGVLFSEAARPHVKCAYPADGQTDMRWRGCGERYVSPGHPAGVWPDGVPDPTGFSSKLRNMVARNTRFIAAAGSITAALAATSVGATLGASIAVVFAALVSASVISAAADLCFEPGDPTGPWLQEWVPHATPPPAECKPGMWCTLDHHVPCELQWDNADPRSGSGLLLTRAATELAHIRPPGASEHNRACRLGRGPTFALVYGGECAYPLEQWDRFRMAAAAMSAAARESGLAWWSEVVLGSGADNAVEAVFLRVGDVPTTPRAANLAGRRGVHLLLANGTRADEGGELFTCLIPFLPQGSYGRMGELWTRAWLLLG